MTMRTRTEEVTEVKVWKQKYYIQHRIKLGETNYKCFGPPNLHLS